MIEGSSQIRVAIIGGRQASPEGIQFAYEVGKLLAENGVILYTGGGPGIMEAASRGAHEAGGIVVGVLKEEDGDSANKYVQIPLMTGMGDLRNGIIIRSVHGAIAVEGAYGTLSEVAFTLGYEKPVLGFHTWNIKGLEPVEAPDKAVNRILQLIKTENS